MREYKEIRIEGMVYRLYEDKTAGIVVTYEDHPADLVLPEKITYEDEDYILAGIEARLFDLTSIVLPKTIAHLRPKAFTGCAKTLRSITIPGNVKFIGEQAFEDCEALTSVVLEDGVLAIGDMAFSGCKNLTSIKLSNTLLFIGSCAFSNCKSLTTIEMPDTVLFLGGGAFRRCANLQSVTLSHKLTRIESFCLESCGNLTSLVIPRSVTNLEDGAFQSRFDEPTNKRLHSIIVEDKNTKYDSRENCNAIIETKSNTLVKACKKTVIPEDVTSIGDFAFSDFGGLTSITIPKSVTSIKYGAFSNCGNLTSVTIPNSVKSIGEQVFSYCGNLVISCYQDSEIYKYAINNNIPVKIIPAAENPWADTKKDEQSGNTGNNSKPDDSKQNNTEPATPAKKGTTLTVSSKKIKVKVTSSSKKNPTVTITKFTDKKARKLTIPATVKVKGVTYKVTSISDKAFKGNKKLTTVTIGSNVTKIGKEAFAGCKNLKKITVTAGKLKTISKNAFKGINKKATITVKGTKKAKTALKKQLKKKSIGYVKTWKIK